jgi:hypothetical protein
LVKTPLHMTGSLLQFSACTSLETIWSHISNFKNHDIVVVMLSMTSLCYRSAWLAVCIVVESTLWKEDQLFKSFDFGSFFAHVYGIPSIHHWYMYTIQGLVLMIFKSKVIYFIWFSHSLTLAIISIIQILILIEICVSP